MQIVKDCLNNKQINHIVYMETGLGKTLISTIILYKYLKEMQRCFEEQN